MKSTKRELEKLRDLLWESLEDADAEKRAGLAREYRTTVEKIAAMKGESKEGDPIDELASRRTARAAGAAKGEGRAKRAGR